MPQAETFAAACGRTPEAGEQAGQLAEIWDYYNSLQS